MGPEHGPERRLMTLGPLARRTDRRQRRFRRGVYLLPSLFTLANIFCGYACVIQALHGQYENAALFIAFAMVVDILDGRIARLTRTESAFGREFDSLADVISFGVAPAVLAYSWGLGPLGRLGWATGFIFVTAAAMRLARFNIQTSTDKRYFVGMPSPAAAAVPAATVFTFPVVPQDYRTALVVLAAVLLPAFLMVSTIRFRSFKTIDLQAKRSYTVLILIAIGLVAIATHPRPVLIVLAYAYLASGLVGAAVSRLRRRQPEAAAPSSQEPAKAGDRGTAS
jgi:CDP-diacylglycerol---serine O-phosphatidyltransferase